MAIPADVRRQAAEMYASGATSKAVAAQLGLCVRTVLLAAREAGVEIRAPGPRKSAAIDERAQRMCQMYAQGMTLAKIGSLYSLTRERVRQIITKAGGRGARLQMMDGLKQQQDAKRKAAIDARCFEKWGIGHAARKQARADGTLARFTQQRANAGRRGIGFELTFGQWLAIWQASGKLDLCGRGKGHYCMSRIKDDGPYAVGNVHIQPCEDNAREAVDVWRGKTKTNRGVFCLYPGTKKPWAVKVGKVRVGYFETEQEAVAARLAYIAETPGRLNRNGQFLKAA